MSMSGEGHKQSHRAAPLGRLWERVAGLFTPQEAVSQDRALTARLIKGVLLASLPIQLFTIIVRLAFGKGLIEA